VGLVLLDLHMPVMDGEQFAQAWSQSPDLRRIPVAVVSTESNEQRIDRLKALGVSDFLPKPFEPESLTKLIKRQLGAAA
jgi:two-component system chemotaxis response regulator CheY